MARRYGQNYIPMWGNSQVEATVCKVDFTNKPYGDKLKSVFYCPSYEKPEGRMCVYWQGRCTVEVGDSVRMIGKFNDGIFLVSSYQILRKGKNISDSPLLLRGGRGSEENSHRHSECEARRISELISESVETQE